MAPMDKNPLIIDASMAAGLDVVGDRWVLLILRDAFLGRTRFEQFRAHTGASRTTLTRRLESLLNADVLCKRSYGKRFDYKLTEKGLGLFAPSLLSWSWESSWTDVSPDVLPVSLFHTECGHSLNPNAVCAHCQQPLEVGDVSWPELSKELDNQFAAMESFNKRRVRTSAATDSQDLSLAYVSDLIGDRWTLLILIAAFLGENRYDGFQKKLNIASNILTDRLNLLVDVSVFEKQSYQENPPRYEYRLTQKGKSLYPLVMTIRQWVLDWLPESSENLIHKQCGQSLKIEVLCGGCGQAPNIKNVERRRGDPTP
jgi:DNA-binding HxlR family transcriptional regulator